MAETRYVILGVIDGYHSTKLQTFQVEKAMYPWIETLETKTRQLVILSQAN